MAPRAGSGQAGSWQAGSWWAGSWWAGSGRTDATIRDLATGLLLTSCSVALLGAAAAALVWPFAVVALLALVVSARAWRRLPGIDAVLAAQGVAPLYRHVLRDAAVLTLVVRTGQHAAPVAVLAGALALVWLVALTAALADGLRARLAPAVLSHGIGAPTRTVTTSTGSRLLDLNAVLLLAAPVAVVATADGVLWTAAGLLAVAGVTVAVRTGVAVARALSARPPSVAQVSAVLREVAPQVMLYSPGEARDSYQVSMWLAALAQLSQPAVVVVRDRVMFAALARASVPMPGPKPVPILCVRNTIDLVNLGFDTVRVVLYPGNFGENIHMLRQPGLRHVFIGHGDSDKMASANPFSRVYDEVWVAGPAGRERYSRADVGVRDDSIVEVGRPQLDALATGNGQRGDQLTVLYAPTWEGWVDSDQRSSSVAAMGERLVAALLANDGVRVMYKPHPLGGTRLRSERHADARIRTLLHRAGATADVAGPAHVIATDPAASLYACFAASDLLVADVSSVLVDYVKTQKPCVVTNAHGIAAEQLRAEVPSARGAYLLSADCSELAQILADLRSGQDPWQEERGKLSAYLLGPDEPRAMARFQDEVTRLCAPRVPTARAPLPTTRPAG